ncbi:MAG: asparagine synthase (glutamine-hydrolyzing) [Acidobacteriota bacterium]
MCGIAGRFLYDRNGLIDAADLKRMCDAIAHRGPDDEGVFACGPVGFGMRRLSIIDLTSGQQPMQTDDGRFTIVFNGEIYNYREVRATLERKGTRFRTESDTECILHAYAAAGPACLGVLNGMFAIAIWDARNKHLFLARDRVGVKPLYLLETARGLVFASEIKAILTDPEVPRRLDEDAFQYFLRYGYVSSPATLLRSVRQVPPAHYLIADENGATVRRYWSLDGVHASDRDVPEQKEMVYALVKRAVERQMVSDVPLGAFLSGGLDSSTMVHTMSEVTGSPVSTYSIGFQGSDAFNDEVSDAKHVAERYGTVHHEIIVEPDTASLIPRLVDHLDQPIADSSFVVTYLVSALARESVKVIISGVGGDELFGGYRRYLGPYLDGYYGVLPQVIRSGVASASAWLPVDRGSAAKNYLRLARSYAAGHGLPRYERYDRIVQLLAPAQVQEVSPSLPSGESELCGWRRRCFNEIPSDDPVGQMLRLDFNTSLVDSLLLLTDKMSMAASLEVRVPFLDHELVEAVAAVPSSLKIARGRLRFIQKESMRGRLPRRVLRKSKRGFGCPVGSWFRTDLRGMLRDTLAPSKLRRLGVLDPGRVQAIILEHEEYREDRTDLLLALLTFQLWCDQWRVA